MSPWRLRQIALQIRRGGIIAYPTDTIWGFGCHPKSRSAVYRIQQLKQRSRSKGLILLSSSLELCEPYLDPSVLATKYDQLSSPQTRAVTWIVKASTDCPNWLTGQSESIAIRITDKPHIKILCQSIQAPLVSTSANISGRNNARSSLIVHKLFHQSVDNIIEGYDTGSQQASVIRDLHTGNILRA